MARMRRMDVLAWSWLKADRSHAPRSMTVRLASAHFPENHLSHHGAAKSSPMAARIPAVTKYPEDGVGRHSGGLPPRTLTELIVWHAFVLGAVL
jgi:hypothetical protein